MNDAVEGYWASLAKGADPNARARYQAAVDRARLEGFIYRQPAALTSLDLPDHELIARLRKLGVAMEGDGATDGPKIPVDEKQLVAALTGAVPEPAILLSTLVEEYEKATRDERLTMSDMQVRKWRLPLHRAVRNIISVLGDKPIADLSRSDAVAFRDWWFERIQEEAENAEESTVAGGKTKKPRPLKAETGNKDLTHIGKMIAKVSDRHDLDLPRRFRGLRFSDEGDDEKRPPYSADFIRDKLLAPGALDGLNEAARGVVLTMVNTGARPSELAALRVEDIHLEADIPFITIIQYRGRKLKTKYSARDLPLVGPSLDGARLLLAAGGIYKDQGGTLSATVNKFLSENDLRETKRHTLYSLRHGFKDRLTDADAPDLIDSELMGHKFERPDYGSGPTLAKKLEWILKIAIYPTAQDF
ncbi:molecular chaperone [Aureimonas phyllosphaerae]|uniref:molecular chaperone n=1 Tax=Aureimonas phyllosphaerae TaxID=1166078 RepID=UPI003A5BA8CB